MRFPYHLVRFTQPFLSLGGRTSRPRPLVMISLEGPLTTQLQHARIDSGSDDSLFPESVANTIGLDLSAAPVEIHQTQSLGNLTVRFAPIVFRLTDGVEFRKWPATVGFVQNLYRPALGIAGFLQFFTATFFGDDEIVELPANRLYPGT